MNEEEMKYICKSAVQNTHRNISDLEKEIMKKGIENAKTVDELISLFITVIMTRD